MANSSDYYYEKGLNFLNEENYDEALMYIDKAIEMELENVDYLSIEVYQKLRSRMRNKSLTVEERDSITISSNEKEPLQTEYIDELFIEKVTKEDNEIQIVDQMEIFKITCIL